MSVDGGRSVLIQVGWARRGLAFGVVAVVAAGSLVGPGSWPAMAAPQACTEDAGTDAAAVAMAAACGEPVAVEASRTEFVQVVAQPDGRLRFESAAVPQRARTAAGWADVNLDLARGADGRWRPAVSVADVAFSGGGTGPLVTLVRGGRTLTLSWPASLPAPTVSGEALTYPNVLPEVDLVVRATRAGFGHTLVVKSATAAENPALQQIRFGLGGDVVVSAGLDGGLRAVAGGATVATAEPAVMWDSRTPAPVGGSAAGETGQASRSTPAEAGDGAQVGPVDVEVSGGDLLLRPDADLLTGPDVVYPVFVDPAWSVFKYKWAYATNTGASNSDHSRARVGKDPNSSNVYRSFFQFSMTAGNGVSLKYKHIESARVEMHLDHSYACTPTIASMYRTPSINKVMQATWSVMTLQQQLATASGDANEGGGCGPIAGDEYMNFQGAAVTAQLQTAANGAWGSIAFGFTARDENGAGETTMNRWKKFYPEEAKLFVDYDSKPGPPNGLQVAGVACPASGVLTVGTLSPTFSAVFPDADGSADSLTGQFEWVEVPSGGIGAVTDTSPARKTPPPNKLGVTPNSRATSAAVTIVTNKTYAYRARATDKAPYSLPSNWSAWCQFAADTSDPVPTATMVTTPAGPGLKGRVRFESTATDVTKFKYGWDAATKEVAAQGTNPRWAEVDVTAQSFGRNVLFVRAVDATLNEGSGSVEFTVGIPSLPVARWGMEAYPGVTQAEALADQQPEAGAGGDTPLTGTQLAWTADARLVGGQTVTFNGGSSQAVAADLKPDTTASFSVAAWARVQNTSGYHTFVSKDGAAGGWSTFRLAMVNGTWCFTMNTSQTTGDNTFLCSAAGTAVANRWTHVAGSYDKAEGKMRLWVNGAPSEKSFTTPTTTTGPIVVGRAMNGGSPADRTYGSVADVQVFDRVLVDHDFTGQLAGDELSGGRNEPGILSPVGMGRWTFEPLYRCYLTDLRDTCQAEDKSTSWGRWLALTRGSTDGTGHLASDVGLWLDYSYFPDEGYSEATQEYGRSAYMTGLTPPDPDGLEYTVWQDAPVVHTDQSFTMSTWVTLNGLSGERTAVSQRGAHESAAWLKFSASAGGKWRFAVSDEDTLSTQTAGVNSIDLAEEGVWTHLVGVYDAGRGELRLYVNGKLQGKLAITFTPMTSSGPLLVGRALWHDEVVDQWTGGIDDVAVFQGAMTDAAVAQLHDTQSAG